MIYKICFKYLQIISKNIKLKNKAIKVKIFNNYKINNKYKNHKNNKKIDLF